MVAFSLLGNETTGQADVVFPLESHAEKDGTVTHPDGRIQRVRPSARRPGDIRPGWQMLAELSALLGRETGIESAPDALAAVADAVPFYAGLTDAEIGGRGVRWQDRPAADALPEVKREVRAAGAPSRKAQSSLDGAPASPHLTLGTYRDLWAGPVTEHNPPLRFLAPVQTVELSLADAEKLGVADGDEVTVGSNGTTVSARVALRERVQAGSCFLIEGTLEGNANALLNGVPQTLEIQRVET